MPRYIQAFNIFVRDSFYKHLLSVVYLALSFLHHQALLLSCLDLPVLLLCGTGLYALVVFEEIILIDHVFKVLFNFLQVYV